jgi:hypothetical protein
MVKVDLDRKRRGRGEGRPGKLRTETKNFYCNILPKLIKTKKEELEEGGWSKNLRRESGREYWR